MDTRDILTDAFGRVREEAAAAVSGLDGETLAARPEKGANSIGWLIWHLTRVQDDHVADIAGRDQVYVVDGWADRFGLPADVRDIGYGHTSGQVAAVRPDGPDTLMGYHDAVHTRTLDYLATIDAAELDRIIDYRWEPPVSVGVRLVSVISDCLQHAGQANYVRGMLERQAES